MIVLDPTSISLPFAAVILCGGLLAVVILLRQSSSVKTVPIQPRVIHTLETRNPIVGDLLELARHAAVRHDWFATQCARLAYEPFVLKVPFTPPMVVLSNEADVHAVLTTQFDEFIKGAFTNDVMRDLVGDGLLSNDGDQWHHQRKTATKFFSGQTLRRMMMHTMQKNMTKMYEVLDAKCSTGELVDLSLLFRQFTLQTFTEVGVGVEFPVLGNEKPSPFEAALDATTPLIMRRVRLPTFVWKLERWLNIGQEKQFAEFAKVARDNAHTMITEGLARLTQRKATFSDEENVRSAIDLFAEHSDPDKLGLRPEDFVAFMLNFVIGARGTTAITLSWFFYAVMTHPDVKAKLRRELAGKLPSLGVTTKSDYITADHVKHLVYLEATIKETLRLYPAVPANIRQAVDDTIVNGNLFIKKGQVTAIPIYAMARNVNVWGLDANEFKPERWIDTDTGELIPLPADRPFSFSAGPRSCIGMKLAMVSLRVVTANLLYRFKMEIDPRNDGSYITSTALMMKHDLLANVEPV